MENPSSSFDDLFSQFKRDLVEQARTSISTVPPNRPFESLKQLQEKSALETQEALDTLTVLSENGITLLFNTLFVMEKSDEALKLLKWLDDHKQEISDQFKQVESQVKQVESQEKMISLPNEYRGWIYQAIQFLHQNQRAEDAISVIMISLFLNPLNFDIWLLYGRILEEKHQFEEALHAYTIAESIQERNPYPIAYSVKPWIALGAWDKGFELIQKAKALCTFEADQEILHYCEELEKWMHTKKPAQVG